MYKLPSAAPTAKTSGREGDQLAVKREPTHGSVTWHGRGASALKIRTEESVETERKTLRWKGENCVQ